MKKSANYISYLSLALLLQAGSANVQAQGAPPPPPAGVQANKPAVSLKVGDAAPKIYAAKWFKGTPVTSFKKGHVYAIEFWATWCGPCRAAMPHLSELAHKYKKDVTIIGFNVKELIAADNKDGDYLTKVANFVENLGDGMDYPVAADVKEDLMWNNWMAAAGLGGIPTTFVIDQKGKIAWIGHPMYLDEVLTLVTQKKFNNVSFQLLKKENKDKLDAFVTEWKKIKESNDYNKIIALADDMMVKDPLSKSAYTIAKYQAFRALDATKALQYLEYAGKENANNPMLLQSLAKEAANTSSEAEMDAAVKMMEQATARCAPDDPYAYSALAAIYFKSKDIQNAVKTQEKVVGILEDTSLVKQKATVIDGARKALEEYKAAL